MELSNIFDIFGVKFLSLKVAEILSALSASNTIKIIFGEFRVRYHLNVF